MKSAFVNFYYVFLMLFVVSSFVLLQVTTLFGFICATLNITIVPSDVNIVDHTLVLLQATTLFGFICATINTTMVPNYSNIILMCHVFLKYILPVDL